jgi:hypothetical protein
LYVVDELSPASVHETAAAPSEEHADDGAPPSRVSTYPAGAGFVGAVHESVTDDEVTDDELKFVGAAIVAAFERPVPLAGVDHLATAAKGTARSSAREIRTVSGRLTASPPCRHS